MPAADLKLYERGTTTLLAEFDFGTLAGPVESSVWQFDLSNPTAGADPATEVALGCEESDDDGVTWHQAGDVTINRWFQIRATGQDGDADAQTTAWTPVGPGARLSLKTIPAESLRECEAKLVVPAGASTESKKIKLVAYWRQTFLSLSQGFFESGIRGVVGGTGDRNFQAVIYGTYFDEFGVSIYEEQPVFPSGGTLSDGGTPADGVDQLMVLQWKYLGVPHVLYPNVIDLSSYVPTSGKSRWLTLSAGDGPGLTITASTAVTGTAPQSDRPASPDGEVLVWVYLDSAGIVNTADIYYPDNTKPRPHGFNFAGGLDIVVGGGQAMIDNRLCTADSDHPVTLTDDQVTIGYRLPDGNYEFVAEGTAPSHPRAEPLWAWTAASGAIVAGPRDLRRFLGPSVREFVAEFPGTVAVNDASYFTMPYDRRGYIKIPQGIALSCGSIGDRTTGALEGELEYWDGAAWTSFFSDPAYRPLLAFDADPPTANGFVPDSVEITPGMRLRARIAAIPITGGSADPSDVRMVVPIEEVSP